MATQPKSRSYVSGFTLSLGGIMDIQGDLVLPTVTNAGAEEKLKGLCPDCTDPTVVQQFYTCEDKHGPFKTGELAKGKEQDDGSFVRLTREQVEQAKGSKLPEKQFEILVFKREEVERYTVHKGSTYVFRPNAIRPLYGIMIDFLERESEYVLIGVCNLRKLDKFMLVERGLNGQLLLTEMVWPEDVREFDTPQYEVKPELYEMAKTFIVQAAKPFNADDFKKESRERLATLVASVDAGTAVPSQAATKIADDDDALAAALTAALAK